MRFIASVLFSATAFALPAAAQDAGWHSAARDKAIAYHGANMPKDCNIPVSDAASVPGHELQIGEETAARQALIMEFPCQAGAYNTTSVFLLSDQHGTVSELFFPSPQVDVRYADQADATVVEGIVITGFPLMREVVKPVYDSSSRSVTERDKWRGPGDAYSTTQWGFKNGKFEIMLFAVDATFDGQDSPVTLIEIDIW
ncbi:hypothetical protein [Pseudotabrizicola sp. 4114]|uniref:hypothetical protein n=1 Tax=Pseudotabrizicola sp. 4114 TaxID=2817731 RepID=UPI002856C29B|nr:hypothetical protein [Pseudorhodobacter sp. 4114]